MKSIDTDNIDQLPGRRIHPGETFAFRCHPQVSCFNRCCRNLNLFLYPYDVIRLRRRLDIDSDTFLDRYTAMVMREGNCFPDVLLQMVDNDEKTCPFLTPAGCSVYPDRPDSCRTFPMEQGAMFTAGSSRPEILHFFRPPDFCQGPKEEDIWTTEEWIRDQEAGEYNRMTLFFSDFKRRFQRDPWGPQGIAGPTGKMAVMATYNIDRFRQFVFDSTFLKKYRVKKKLAAKLKRDDVALMQFGLAWINLFVWGIRSSEFRPR